MDKTGTPLDPKPPFVVAPVGATYKHVSCMRTGDKSHITVITCRNVKGCHTSNCGI